MRARCSGRVADGEDIVPASCRHFDAYKLITALFCFLWVVGGCQEGRHIWGIFRTPFWLGLLPANSGAVSLGAFKQLQRLRVAPSHQHGSVHFLSPLIVV